MNPSGVEEGRVTLARMISSVRPIINTITVHNDRNTDMLGQLCLAASVDSKPGASLLNEDVAGFYCCA